MKIIFKDLNGIIMVYHIIMKCLEIELKLLMISKLKLFKILFHIYF